MHGQEDTANTCVSGISANPQWGELILTRSAVPSEEGAGQSAPAKDESFHPIDRFDLRE